MRVSRRAVVAVAVVAATVLAAVAGVRAARRGDEPFGLDKLVLAAGEPGQVDYVIAHALAQAARERWSLPVEVVPTTGGAENLRKVADGEAHVGFAALDVAQEALHGETFGRVLPIVALARLYDEYLQIVVPAGSSIQRIADLRGKRVAVGIKDSGADVLAYRILDRAGVLGKTDLPRLSAGTATAQLRSGLIDAIALSGGLPTPVVEELPAARIPIRVLPVSDEEVEQVKKTYEDRYLTRSIPTGTYGLTTDVATLGVPTVLAVNEDMPDGTAYRLTELLFAARNRLVAAHEAARGLDPRSAPATYPAELHSGAKRYYRATKPMAGPYLRPIAGNRWASYGAANRPINREGSLWIVAGSGDSENSGWRARRCCSSPS